jgi:GT2 family glycosyltransferase
VLVFEDAPDKIQFAGYSKINRFTGRNDDKMYGKPISELGKQPYTSNYAHGAAIFTSRANIALTGGMPECYFLYYEEMEWSEQFLSKGKQIYIAPSIQIIHKESISVGKHNPMKTFYISRNRILFMKRNRTAFEFMVFWLYWTLFALPLKCTISLMKLDFKSLRAYIAGTLWHIRKAFTI